jgi:hypothetical protein
MDESSCATLANVSSPSVLDSRAASLTLISFNMTAVVCQLDKLVASIIPTGVWIPLYKGLAAPRKAAHLPDRQRKVPFGTLLAAAELDYLLWQQDLGD